MRKQRISTHRYRIIPAIVLIPIILIYGYYQFAIPSGPSSTTNPIPISELIGSCRNSTRKFIVVTTINYGTESIQKLASLQDWCVIVVGDAKTPRDWSWPNCVYLSLETQADLGYRSLAHLPQNHYGRKNIGYLFAIQHGAEVIYETDDDNLLLTTEIPLVPQSDLFLSLFPDAEAGEKNLAGKRGVCDHVVNIYEYFGQPTIWPRGIPLECLATQMTPPEGIPHAFSTKATQNGVLEKEFQIGVDQGLANGDPDLDAIFRLTRIPANERIVMEFNPEVPLVGISRGTFSPYNSQNTIYYRDAFWGLLLPVTTSSRVSDIWRGYITQRLMWDVGLRLAFRTATVTQYRNPHSYVKDLDQERALYFDAGRLVDFLFHWNSSHAGDNIFSRMISLQMELVNSKFLGPEDASLLRAWVEDLQGLGYAHPRLLRRQTNYGAPPPPISTSSQDAPKTLAWVLHFTYAPIPEVVDLLVRHYAKHFALIVIVTPTGRPSGLRHLESSGTDVLWSSACRNSFGGIPGGAMVRCYVRGLRILTSHPNYPSIDYIVASNDDVILNITKIKEFAVEGRPSSIMDGGETPPLMFSPPPANQSYFVGWNHGGHWATCQPLFAQVPEVAKERFLTRNGEFAFAGAADVFLLPVDSVEEFIEIGDIVGECWLEIGLPNVLGMLSNPPRLSKYAEGLFVYTWVSMAGKDFIGAVAKMNMFAIHPFKLSFPENREAFINFTQVYHV